MNTPQVSQPNQDTLYEWSFSNKKDRSQLWYIISLSIIVGLVIWGMLSKQYMLSFMAIMIAGVWFLMENNSEDLVHVRITQLGIRINQEFVSFASIASYSVIYNADQAIFLQLHTKKTMIKMTNLNINNQIALELEQILPHFIENSWEGQMTVLDRILNILKI